MKYVFFFLFLLNYFPGWAQDGKLIEKKQFTIPDSVLQRLQRDPSLLAKIKDSILFFRIVYLSDGLKVTGYIAQPKASGSYPCIISNRGGNRSLGEWNAFSIASMLGQMASWGYVVIASQYRGNDGGEGKEDFGGDDVHDVLNLLPVLEQIPGADTSRIGIEGTSRGGMMTYLSLKQSNRFKAAVVTAGLANLQANIKERPKMENGTFAELIPNYKQQKEEALKKRSAVQWASEMNKTTPILIMQGSADWRVSADESLELVNALYKAKHPVRFILFEGADHGITEFRNERFAFMKRFFDLYVRDKKMWPSLEPHGL